MERKIKLVLPILIVILILPICRKIADYKLFYFEVGTPLAKFEKEFDLKILYKEKISSRLLVVVSKPKPIWYMDFGTAVYVFNDNFLTDFTYNVDDDLNFLKRQPAVIKILQSDKYQKKRQEGQSVLGATTVPIASS